MNSERGTVNFQTMKLIQITDLHVGKIGDDSYGVNVRQNFLDVLEAVKAENPDRIVISGDLCLHDGEPEVYEWIKGHLDKSGLPFDIISGNHDNAAQIAECFGLNEFLTDGQLFFKKKYDNQTFLFLDTTDYTLPETQLIWLEKELKNLNEELIIFIHHPPVKSGVPFMDNKYFFIELLCSLFKVTQTLKVNYTDQFICRSLKVNYKV